MYDLLIVGGGPSAVAAAAYAKHLGLDMRLISPVLGGKVNYKFSLEGLDHFEAVHGTSLVQTFAAIVSSTQHLPHTGRVVEPVAGGFRVLTTAASLAGRALIVATGAQPRRLHVPGEEAFWQRGLSYSAISHAPLFIGKTVAVIGNDRRAQVAALELARVARQVLFIAPRPLALNGALLTRLAERDNTILFEGWEVTAVVGGQFVSGVKLQSAEGMTREEALEGVFVELGLIPNSGLVADLVERDERGFIKVDHTTATSRAGLFAAGDVTNVPAEQVPVALGEGIKAALSASEYLAAS